jgi:predicted DNA-binding transcriptional regulator YafY
LVPVLETRLNLKPQEHNIISFDNNEDYQGKEHITAFFNAILYKRVLKISYQNFKSEFPSDYIFHTYHLKQYNSRWFAFGFNPKTNYQIQNLALDRILTIEEITDDYVGNQFDWDDYFSDIIGVTKTDNEFNKAIDDLATEILNQIADRQLVIADFKNSMGKIPASYVDSDIEDTVRRDFGGDRNRFVAALRTQGLTPLSYRLFN